MGYIHETIKFDKSLPANILVHEVDVVQSHWHESIEILLVAHGEVELLVDGKKYNLKEDDLIIINSKEIHCIKSEKSNIVIAAQIDLSYFNDLYDSFAKDGLISKNIVNICKYFKEVYGAPNVTIDIKSYSINIEK